MACPHGGCLCKSRAAGVTNVVAKESEPFELRQGPAGASTCKGTHTSIADLIAAEPKHSELWHGPAGRRAPHQMYTLSVKDRATYEDARKPLWKRTYSQHTRTKRTAGIPRAHAILDTWCTHMVGMMRPPSAEYNTGRGRPPEPRGGVADSWTLTLQHPPVLRAGSARKHNKSGHEAVAMRRGLRAAPACQREPACTRVVRCTSVDASPCHQRYHIRRCVQRKASAVTSKAGGASQAATQGADCRSCRC